MSSQPETSQFDADHRYAPGEPGDHPDLDEPTGPPYRAIAMVLLAAVVLAVGVGLVQLFGSDDETPAADEGTSQVEQSDQQGQPADPGEQGQPGDVPAGQDPQNGPDGQPAPGAAEQPGQPGQQPADPQSPAAQTGAGTDVTSVPVQVFNNSNVTGLAGRTGEALRESGFAVGDVANLPSNRGVVSESTVYYGNGPGERQAAEAVGAQLGIPALPRPADLATGTPGVIVIVTQDLDR